MIVDVHHHFLPKALLDNLADLLPAGLEVSRNGDVTSIRRISDGYVYPAIHEKYWSDPRTQIESMDAAGVQHAIVSPSCFQDWMTIPAARVINDGTAALVGAYPERFSGMISAPQDGGEAMVREIHRARDELGLCALNMTTTYKGKFPDHQDFRLFLATAAELDLPVFVHPSWVGSCVANLGEWSLERTLGKPADLNLCVARLLFAGVFSELPQLRMVFGHLGGNLPMNTKRLFLGQPGYVSAPERDYETLLKRVFVDTAPGMWQSSEEIEYAARKLGASQLMLGSDYPLSMDPAGVLCAAVDHVRNAQLSAGDREKIFSSNAMHVFTLRRLHTAPS